MPKVSGNLSQRVGLFAKPGATSHGVQLTKWHRLCQLGNLSTICVSQGLLTELFLNVVVDIFMSANLVMSHESALAVRFLLTRIFTHAIPGSIYAETLVPLKALLHQRDQLIGAKVHLEHTNGGGGGCLRPQVPLEGAGQERSNGESRKTPMMTVEGSSSVAKASQK